MSDCNTGKDKMWRKGMNNRVMKEFLEIIENKREREDDGENWFLFRLEPVAVTQKAVKDFNI